MRLSLLRRAALECVGTAFLLAAIVGSGIMAQNLASGNVALALLCNTVATSGALVALVATLGPLSGAHLNPAVTLAEAAIGSRPWREVIPYVAGQLAGAIAGVAAANGMFGKPLLFPSHRARSSGPELFAEAVATFGLLFVIFLGSRARPAVIPFTVAAYIAAAYWFTSSTSFANPAVTIARSLSDTFAGIRPADVPGFVGCEIAGALIAIGFTRWAFRVTVLFVCIHNSARSQMAEAITNALCSGKVKAYSAGLERGLLNPLAVEAMKEIGIDISSNATKTVDDPKILGRSYDYVVTVCDEASAERCPAFAGGGKRLHWTFPDPSTFSGTHDEALEQVRLVRRSINAHVARWCKEICA